MNNPIIEREFVATMRTRKSFLILLVLGIAFCLLILVRWPTDSRVALSGAQSQDVFRLFGYGILATVLLLAPVFPATSIVKEKRQGTLALLLNSTMHPISIYMGKLVGIMGFVVLLLSVSAPAAAACFAMGALSLDGQLLALYGILLVAALQYTCLGLMISSYVNSTDAGLKLTYGCVLILSILTLGPHLFLQGSDGMLARGAEWLRCVSPIPAVMELLGQSGVGAQGIVSESGVPLRYVQLALLSSAAFAWITISRLNFTIFDQSRDAGVMTDDRDMRERVARRVFFLIDPQRRKPGIAWWLNPVMVKEFRTRRFGRFHWLLRLVAICALISLGLTYAATTGTMDWGVETIGGIMVVLQVTLIVLLTPSLAAGLVSNERETGGWDLLRATPLSPARILTGKIMSVVWTLLLLLFATVPGYVVMVFIKPGLEVQVQQVLICLLWSAAFAMLSSAMISSLFSRTAPATVTAYAVLVSVCAGTMLFWLGRGAPFGYPTVEAALMLNPMAAALNVIEAPGFENFELIPGNWWVMGIASSICLLILLARVWKLSRPT